MPDKHCGIHYVSDFGDPVSLEGHQGRQKTICTVGAPRKIHMDHPPKEAAVILFDESDAFLSQEGFMEEQLKEVKQRLSDLEEEDV